MTAEAVADAGLERVDQDVVRAPAIPVGIAEEHRQFPGTMWVSEDTFRNYVGEAVESLAHHGFDRIVIVNGHGGNVDALREVGGQLTRNGDAYVVPFTWFEGVGEHTADMGHGGPSRRDSCATSNRTAFERSGSTRPGRRGRRLGRLDELRQPGLRRGGVYGKRSRRRSGRRRRPARRSTARVSRRRAGSAARGGRRA